MVAVRRFELNWFHLVLAVLIGQSTWYTTNKAVCASMGQSAFKTSAPLPTFSFFFFFNGLLLYRKKQSQTLLTAAEKKYLKKSKTRKRLIRTLFNQTRQNVHFTRESASSNPRPVQKQIAAASWVLPDGGKTLIVLVEPNWQQLSYLFVFVFFMALRKRIHTKSCILLCLWCL